MSRIEEFFEKSVDAGLIPQIPMNYDAVSYKIYTGYLENKIDELTAEVAELRARLEKAVELPCEVGDTIYWICKACDAPCECKYYTCEYPEGAECHAPSLPYGYSSGVCFSDEIVNDECKKHLYVEEWKFNLRFLNPKTGKLEPQFFIDREAAEARLKELQGGER